MPKIKPKTRLPKFPGTGGPSSGIGQIIVDVFSHAFDAEDTPPQPRLGGPGPQILDPKPDISQPDPVPQPQPQPPAPAPTLPKESEDLPSDYSDSDLPYPDSSSESDDEEEPTAEEEHRVWRHNFQTWCCEAASILIRMKQAAGKTSTTIARTQSGKLAWKLVNVPKNPLSRNDLISNMSTWKSEGHSIVQGLTASEPAGVQQMLAYLGISLGSCQDLIIQLQWFPESFQWYGIGQYEDQVQSAPSIDSKPGTDAKPGTEKTGMDDNGKTATGGAGEGGGGNGGGDKHGGHKNPQRPPGDPELLGWRMQYHALSTALQNSLRALIALANQAADQAGQPLQPGVPVPGPIPAPVAQQALNNMNNILAEIIAGPPLNSTLVQIHTLLRRWQNLLRAVWTSLPRQDPAWVPILHLFRQNRLWLQAFRINTRHLLAGNEWYKWSL